MTGFLAVVLAVSLPGTSANLPIHAPESLVLGRDTSAVVTLPKRPGPPPRLLVSEGTVDPVSDGGEGLLSATYHTPSGKFPRIAILAAIGADGRVEGWTTIRLFGQARITTESKPRAKVTVRVGDQTLGPEVADGRGHAEFIATVPPGLTTASSVAEDRLGAVKETVLDLQPPPFSRLLAVCGTAATLEVVVLDTAGAPALRVLKGRASLLPPQQVVPGLFRSGVELASAASDQLEVEADLPGSPASRCLLDVPGEAPVSLSVSSDVQSWQAGSGKLVRVTVEPRYPGRRHAAPAEVTLSADLGSLELASLSVSGPTTLSWKLPDILGERRRASLVARSGALSGSAEVSLLPGPVASLEVTAPRSTLLADGRRGLEIRARARDAFGNRVDEPRLTGSAEAGTLADFQGDHTTYIPPLLFRPASGTLNVREVQSGTTGFLPLRLAPMHRLLSIGVKGGLLTNFGSLSAPLFGLEASLRPARFDGRMAFGLELGWYDGFPRISSPVEPVSVRVTTVPVMARASWDPLALAGAYLGLSAGLFLTQSTISSPSSGSASTFTPVPAFGPVAGWEWFLGSGRFAVEGAWQEADLSGQVRGNLGGLSLSTVYRKEF